MQTLTQADTSQEYSQQISYKFFFAMSVLIWLVGTVVMRLWGQLFFIPESKFSMLASFAALLLSMPPLVYGLFRWQRLQPSQYAEATICLTIPSLCLDAIATFFFPQVFPNFPYTTSSAFSSWLMSGYTMVLIASLIAVRKSRT